LERFFLHERLQTNTYASPDELAPALSVCVSRSVSIHSPAYCELELNVVDLCFEFGSTTAEIAAEAVDNVLN
jgi:hypothetical protein